MPKAKRKSSNLYNNPIEVLSDEDDSENDMRNEQSSGDSRPLPNKENNDTRDSNFIHSSPTTDPDEISLGFPVLRNFRQFHI